MPFDGNGNWSSNFSAINDRDANIKILASRFDNIFIKDIGETFDKCLTRDGQGKTLVPFNANNFKIINVANPVDANDGANKSYVDSKVASIVAVKPGTIIAWPVATGPDGYLKCDGAAVSRTTYADLFAIISTTYGSGDGSTTFNIPNFQGCFLRGYLSGTSAELGVRQESQNLAHTHTIDPNGARYGADAGGLVKKWCYGDTGPDRSLPVTSSSSGGTESRPVNYAVNWFIKY